MAMSEGFVNSAKPVAVTTTILDFDAVYRSLLTALTSLVPSDEFTPIVLEHIAHVCAHQMVYMTLPNPILLTEGFPVQDSWRAQVAMVNVGEWNDLLYPYLRILFGASSSSGDESPEHRTSSTFRSKLLGDVPDDQFEVDGDDANLCNIEFSLAFGGKILLHNTHLRLGKGRKYGLLGKNGSGKTVCYFEYIYVIRYK
jgi:hypothetical protein